MVHPDVLAPHFEPEVVARDLKDGYWIEAADIDGDGRLDLVTSGLAIGEVVWYQNPGWKKYPIATLPKPVALDHADIDGDGRLDLVICHDYGSCMYNCKPEDGKISWLRNPGTYDAKTDWDVHPVAELMATHRLRFGHFTQASRLELMALPVVGPAGVHEPIQVMLYKVPDDVQGASAWDGALVDGDSFRIIHDVVVDRFGARAGSELQSVVLASEEGITWLHYDERGSWKQDRFAPGEQGQVEQTHFKGTGNVAVGRIGPDPYAYIATIEPFHGNTVSVYSKDASGQLSGTQWKRTILDVYADPNESGEGPGHHVMCGDFDGDGDDEFLVALRGPMPWQGVFYYKAIDAAKGIWTKTRVSTPSAARIAVGDFDGDGRLDFATTGYYTPGYFLCADPQVTVFYNRFAPVAA
ncbi:MAG: VCBS repeat-containing protein [Dehalococcoidia bacterium]|nr:VCBS repeat-containing protein [Dehalococcoidia bacterium]